MLEAAKTALRITVPDFDFEIMDLIDAAKLDLGIAGVVLDQDLDALVKRAVITYVRCHFGSPDPQDYDRLKASYDEQKGQLRSATGYTYWGDDD